MRQSSLQVDSSQNRRLFGQVCRIDEITDAQRSQMFDLMQSNYANVNRSEFESDFDQKDWVIVAKDPQCGTIRGFSTQVTYSIEFAGEPANILFSGDTIVEKQYWGNNPLTRLWGRLALTLIDQSAQPLYWFLISKGYKTYRFLPVFFRDFYPRYDKQTPVPLRQLIAQVAADRFGTQYLPSGIIKASCTACRLRDSIADVTPERLKDPHVAFFHQVNPGHAKGDELCCIAPLTRGNFNRKAYRVIGSNFDPPVVLHGTATLQ